MFLFHIDFNTESSSDKGSYKVDTGCLYYPAAVEFHMHDYTLSLSKYHVFLLLSTPFFI